MNTIGVGSAGSYQLLSRNPRSASVSPRVHSSQSSTAVSVPSLLNMTLPIR